MGHRASEQELIFLIAILVAILLCGLMVICGEDASAATMAIAPRL